MWFGVRVESEQGQIRRQGQVIGQGQGQDIGSKEEVRESDPRSGVGAGEGVGGRGVTMR